MYAIDTYATIINALIFIYVSKDDKSILSIPDECILLLTFLIQAVTNSQVYIFSILYT